MITEITVKIKNSEQKYSHDFVAEGSFTISGESEQAKGMINTALKCMKLADNVLTESLDIEVRSITKWQ